MNKRWIEIYWSLIGGFGLALFVYVIDNNPSSFRWERFFKYERWFDLGYLDFRGKFDKIIGINGGSLIVGFLITYFLIYTIKRYRQGDEE
jgi:hypothetical protein